MFAASKTDSVSAAVADAQFNYVTMLLHGDGTNGAQNNTFLDSSTNNFTITRNGNTTQGSFSPYGSNWSNYFDGSGDYLQIAKNTAFDFGSGSFTLECWVHAGAFIAATPLVGQQQSSGSSRNSLSLRIDASGNPQLQASAGTSNDVLITSSTAMSLNTWNHVAGVRNGNDWTLYLNGVSVGTATSSITVNYDATYGDVLIGASRDVASFDKYYTGYISNARIVKGTAVYTSSFTPSTTPLTAISGTSLLTSQSNRFIDNSANNFTITVNGNTSVQRFNPFGASTAYSTSVIGGSGYFDGTSDSLTYTGGSSLNFGTSDFTIELWVFLTNTGTYSPFLRPDDSGAFPEFGYNFSTGQLQFDARNAAIVSVTTTLPTNQWTHVAVSRSGTSLRLFINGTQVGSTTTNSTNFGSTTGAIRVGGSSFSATHNVNGYISNFRVLKGTAQYTSNFTPPTAPLTAITNTTLLLSYTNGAIFDNAMMNDLETVGNAQISTSVKKYGTGSLAFDGTGDYLLGKNVADLSFGTGDFTLECWANWTATVADGGFVGSNSTGGMDFAYLGGTLRIGRVNTAWDSTFSSFTPTAGVWYHIAFTRNSGTARAFVNGTQVGSSLSNTNSYAPTGGVIIGASNAGDRNFKGYIDDLRITKGYARYTSNFTAPTAAFSDTGPY